MFAFPSSDHKGPLVFTIDPRMVSMSTYFNLFLARVSLVFVQHYKPCHMVYLTYIGV